MPKVQKCRDFCPLQLLVITESLTFSRGESLHAPLSIKINRAVNQRSDLLCFCTYDTHNMSYILAEKKSTPNHAGAILLRTSSDGTSTQEMVLFKTSCQQTKEGQEKLKHLHQYHWRDFPFALEITHRLNPHKT